MDWSAKRTSNAVILSSPPFLAQIRSGYCKLNPCPWALATHLKKVLIFRMARQPIAAKQQDVSRCSNKVIKVDLHGNFRPERPDNDVLHLGCPGLLCRNQSPSHLLHYQRMIISQLLDRVVSYEVNPTITDMSDRVRVVFNVNCHDRRTHSRLTGVPIGGFEDGSICELDRAANGIRIIRDFSASSHTVGRNHCSSPRGSNR